MAIACRSGGDAASLPDLIHPIRMARVLIIDDDHMLREVLALGVQQFGHTVLQAEDGQKGLDLVRATQVDVVVTDLIMPVKEGVETIIALRRSWPDLPVIAISGGATNARLYLDIAGKIGARRILPKPFSASQLNELIAEVLAEGKTGSEPGPVPAT